MMREKTHARDQPAREKKDDNLLPKNKLWTGTEAKPS